MSASWLSGLAAVGINCLNLASSPALSIASAPILANTPPLFTGFVLSCVGTSSIVAVMMDTMPPVSFMDVM